MQNHHGRWLAMFLTAGLVSLAGCKPIGSSSGLNWPGTRAQFAEDGEWTVLLYVHRDDSHPATARQHLTDARRVTGWDGLEVVHHDGYSELLWGRYLTREDAEKNVQIARTYRTPRGQAIYARAVAMRIPGKNVGNPKWNLDELKVPGYTVQVATYFDIPDRDWLGRKRRAAELVERMRQQGLEAYYRHGISKSIVTIGTFPPEAITIQKVKKVHSVTGDVAIQDQPVIVSERLKALLEEYPELLVNGNTVLERKYDPQAKQFRKVPRPTGAIPIQDDTAAATSP